MDVQMAMDDRLAAESRPVAVLRWQIGRGRQGHRTEQGRHQA
jgi:hypothetical protein